MAVRQTYNWSPATTLTREQTASILYQAGFRGQALTNMVAIAGRESGYKPGIHGSSSPQSAVSGDRGLLQINSVNDARLKAAGIIQSSSDLFDPLINARAAYFLSNGGTNLSPWTSGPGGWSAGGNAFYGTNLTLASNAVKNAAASGFDLNAAMGDLGGLVAPSGNPFGNLGKFGQFASGALGGAASGAAGKGTSGGTGAAGGAYTPGPPTAAWTTAQQNAFTTWLKQQPVDQQTAIVNWLHADNPLPEVARYLNDANTPGPVKSYLTDFLAQLPRDQSRQLALSLTVNPPSPAYTAATPDSAGSQQMTDLLKTFGVDYPNAPQPTPALLAFMNGLGLQLSTAEDVKRRALERIGAATSDAMADIDRTAGRTKQNITADLVRRGVLSSGEANTRYANQAQDVASQQKQVQTSAAGQQANASDAYENARAMARQQALDKVIGAEQDQTTAAALAKQQAEALAQQTSQEDLNWAREQAAQQTSLKTQTDAIAAAAARGVAV